MATTERSWSADMVIMIGDGDGRPLLPGNHYEDWELDDRRQDTRRDSANTRQGQDGATLLQKPASMRETQAGGPISGERPC
jgi:hypothetical protein